MFSPGPPPLMTPPHRPALPPAIIADLQLDDAMEPVAALAAGSTTVDTCITLEAALVAEAAAPALTVLAPVLADDQSDSPFAELLTPRVRVASAGSPDSDTFVASWPSAASSVSTFSVSPQSPFVKIRSSSIPNSPVVPLTLNATA